MMLCPRCKLGEVRWEEVGGGPAFRQCTRCGFMPDAEEKIAQFKDPRVAQLFRKVGKDWGLL